MRQNDYKFAFTSRALWNAIDKYGDRLFEIEEPRVLLDALCQLPELRFKDVASSWNLQCIVRHWHDLKDLPPWAMPPTQENELKIIAKLDERYPDKVKVVYSTLEEYLFLNRVFGNDELLNVSELGAWLPC